MEQKKTKENYSKLYVICACFGLFGLLSTLSTTNNKASNTEQQKKYK